MVNGAVPDRTASGSEVQDLDIGWLAAPAGSKWAFFSFFFFGYVQQTSHHQAAKYVCLAEKQSRRMCVHVCVHKLWTVYRITSLQKHVFLRNSRTSAACVISFFFFLAFWICVSAFTSVLEPVHILLEYTCKYEKKKLAVTHSEPSIPSSSPDSDFNSATLRIRLARLPQNTVSFGS